MGVKLLPKSKLQELKAKQTSMEIAEGLKIAKRVDGLRETYSRVEQELEAYRNATLMEIHSQIQDASEKLEDILSKIRQNQAKFDRMKPDMEAKKQELKDFEKSLRLWEKELIQREEEIISTDKKTVELNFQATNSFLRQEDNERITRNLLIRAKERESEAQQTLETAKGIENKVYSDKKYVEAALILREYSVKTKEKELNLQATENTNDRKAIEVEKFQLKDQRETLQRSMVRIKQGKQP